MQIRHTHGYSQRGPFADTRSSETSATTQPLLLEYGIQDKQFLGENWSYIRARRTRSPNAGLSLYIVKYPGHYEFSRSSSLRKMERSGVIHLGKDLLTFLALFFELLLRQLISATGGQLQDERPGQMVVHLATNQQNFEKKIGASTITIARSIRSCTTSNIYMLRDSRLENRQATETYHPQRRCGGHQQMSH